MHELLRSAAWSRYAHYPPIPWLIAGGIATAVAMLGSRLRRFEVAGESMVPTLLAGDRVVIARTRRLHAGDLAVVRDPDGRLVVKRAIAVSAAGVTVQGDNAAASTDSRHYGPLARTAVQGRVLYRYHPPSRRGRRLATQAGRAFRPQAVGTLRGDARPGR